MIIENRQLHVILWLKNLVSTIIYVLLIFAIYLTSFFEHLLEGVNRNLYTIIFGVIYFGIIIYPNILKYSFIHFSDTEGKITINFYLVGFLAGKKQSIKIPLKELYDVEVTRSLLGIRKSVILYRKMGNKIAKYPPVYITALSKGQQIRMINTLSRYAIKKKQ